MKKYLGVLLVLLLVGCSDEQGEQAMGVVERDRIVLSAPVAEQIAQVNVQEGAHVEAGDLLLQLDDRHAQLLVVQKQASLELAQAQLQQLQTGARSEQIARAQAAVRAAQAQADEANLRYQRISTLYQKKMVTKSDFDEARAYQKSMAAQLAQAEQQQLELQNGTRSEEIVQAQAQVKLAQAALDDAQRTMDDLRLVAPKAGVVDIVPWKQGDRVAMGVQLITLLSDERLYARVYLPATALAKVKPGDQLALQVDGNAQAINGIITNIRSRPAYTPYFALNERDRARLMYLTDIELPKDADLAVGMGVEVSLP